MDERTRTTDDDVSPDLRRTAPAPIIKSRRGRTRIVVGLIVLIAIVGGAYLIFRSIHTAQPSGGGRIQQAPPQSVDWAAAFLSSAVRWLPCFFGVRGFQIRSTWDSLGEPSLRPIGSTLY